jgi:gliding motility-associated-like protein
MGLSCTKLLRYGIVIALLTGLFSYERACAQSGLCDPSTPFFNVNLTGNPNATWISSPPVARNGNCCNTTAPDKCIEFIITLDSSALAITFSIASGAVPPGAMYYQLNCGPQTPVGQPICITGPGPHVITFCKPGNNNNTYQITSIGPPGISPNDTTSSGCTAEAYVTGVFIDSTIVWSEITSGTNAYLSYLNCTVGCDTVTITPQPGYPPFVDYVVCGTPLAGVCYPATTFCDTIRIYFLPPILASVTPTPATFCANNPSGVTMTASVTGGAPPYTINWTNAGNGAGTIVGTSTTFTATTPGTYSLVVYDQTYPDCPPAIFNIPVSTTPVPIVNAGPNITVCANSPSVQLNGFVANATGGIWSGGLGSFSPSNTTLNATYTPTASEIANGSVTLTLTSTGNGTCLPVSDQVTISFSQFMTVSIQPPIICFGQTGTLTAVVTGGTPPYVFLWNTGATTQTISNAAPGNYTVTVTDATQNACVVTQSVTVTQNPQIVLNVPSNNVISCNATTLITISASGGNGNLSYLWNTGDTTTSITVPSGAYIITATDPVGCSASDTITITAANTTLTASINQPPNLCFGATTTLQATATGGFGGYSYQWSTNQTSSSITAGAGSYCVTVTDAGGCINSSCVTVSQSPQLTASISAPPVVCSGGTATLTASASGGAGPYTYQWSTGQTSSVITQPAGSYSVTVTDANTPGCTATASVSITQAQPLTITGTTTPVSCFNGNNGSATASVSGGIAPYTYLWPASNSTSNTIFGQSAGTYQVNVTDAIGCTQTGFITITQPTQLSTSMSNTSVSCYGGSNGSATVTVSGGTPGYQYSWTPQGGTSATAGSLPAGSYTVQVTDANGCVRTGSTVVTQPPQLFLNVTSITHVQCNGGNNGSATVSASGGAGGYSYLWVETGGTSPTASNLYTGTYNIVATDASGCTISTSVTINQPNALQASVTSVTSPSCNGGSNGSATLTATGGTPGYTYYWPSLNYTGQTANNLSAGIYNFTVTDANGCTYSSGFNMTQPATLLFVTAAGFNASCYGSCNGVAVVVPGGGVPPYNYLWSTGNTTPSIVNLCPGTYSITVTDNYGCQKDTVLNVSQPPLLSLITSSSPADCFQPNGAATVTASGGTPGYSYSWNTNPPQSTPTAANIPPGTYTVTVTDQNNCVQTAPVTVGNTPGVSAFLQSSSNATCNNLCNGSAVALGSGGSGPYTYYWNSPQPQNNDTVTGLCAGSYMVIITDANNCSDTAFATITAPLPLTLNPVQFTGSICIGQSATISAAASGGSGNYVFNWNNGTFYGPSYTVYPTTTTTYTVTVTDGNNCTTGQQTVTVSVQPPLNAIVAPGLSVCQGNTAYLTVSATGGNGLYSYTWYPGGMTGNVVGVVPTANTSYTVQVTDGCGTPADTAVIPVTVNPNPVVNFAANLTTGCAPLCIEFDDNTQVTGDSIVGWLWDFGDNTSTSQQNPTHCFQGSGIFDVSLTAITSNGCAMTYTFSDFINVLPTPTADFVFTPTTTTMFDPGIHFTEMSTGETTYWWNFGDPSDTTTSTMANPYHAYSDSGTYCINLRVTNDFQCFDDTTHCLRINPEFAFFIPNAFTPNSNGLNDMFSGQGINIKEFEMMIFDRWGNLIFTTDKLEEQWDGRANGGQEIAQQDVYVYVVNILDMFGLAHKFIGHVTLIK